MSARKYKANRILRTEEEEKIANDYYMDCIEKGIQAKEVITRNEAESQGLPRYFLPIICKHGHTSERYVKSGLCCQCSYNTQKAYNDKRPGYSTMRRGEWRANNRERDRATVKKCYYNGSYDRQKESGKINERLSKLRLNPLYKVMERLRDKVIGFLKQKENLKTDTLKERHGLDYTGAELKAYLEAQFREGWSWDNYGKETFVIDHIIPTSWFLDTSEEDIRKHCWALKNLRLVTNFENTSKGNIVDEQKVIELGFDKIVHHKLEDNE